MSDPVRHTIECITRTCKKKNFWYHSSDFYADALFFSLAVILMLAGQGDLIASGASMVIASISLNGLRKIYK